MQDLLLLNEKMKQWQTCCKVLKQQLEEEQFSLNFARQEIVELKSVIQLGQYVAQETNKLTEQQTAELATLALEETFDDEKLSLITEHSVYRGQPSCVIKLKDAKRGFQGDPIKSFGGGPVAIVSFILRVIVIVRQQNMARLVILDEPFVHISDSYKKAASKLLRKVCSPPPRGLGFKILVVTQLEAIASAAHKKYWAYDSEDGKNVVFLDAPKEE